MLLLLLVFVVVAVIARTFMPPLLLLLRPPLSVEALSLLSTKKRNTCLSPSCSLFSPTTSHSPARYDLFPPFFRLFILVHSPQEEDTTAARDGDGGGDGWLRYNTPTPSGQIKNHGNKHQRGRVQWVYDIY